MDNGKGCGLLLTHGYTPYAPLWLRNQPTDPADLTRVVFFPDWKIRFYFIMLTQSENVLFLELKYVMSRVFWVETCCSNTLN